MDKKERSEPTIEPLAHLERQLGILPLSEAREAVIQTLFVKGHTLPGVDLSAPKIMEFMKGLGPIAGMNTFHGPVVKTPDSYDEETKQRLGGRAPEDINSILMWDDSGSQLYIFPSQDNWFTISVYTCKAFDEQAVLRYIYDQLHLREDMQFASQNQAGNEQPGWQSYAETQSQTLTPEKEVYELLAQILQVDRTNLSAVIQAGQNIEKIVFQAIREGWEDRLGAMFTPAYTRQFQDIHSQYEIATDQQFASGVLAGKITHPDEYPFQKTYDRLAQMEAQAASMQPGRQVVHIGTGHFPGTAYGLLKLGIPVICVETDPEVAKTSAEVLRRLNLLGKEKLSVVHIDGTQLDTSQFDNVIISAMVPTEDKTRILRILEDLTVDKKQVVLRTTAGARKLIYPPFPSEVTTNIRGTLIAKTQPGLEDPIESLVYRLRPSAEIGRGLDRILFETRNRLKTPQAALEEVE